MKLYQLIKDLQDEGATEALTHLITLDTLITQLENYVSESDNEARAWDITVRYKDALKEPLTLGVFFPCDANGKPLDEPIKIGRGIAEEAQKQAEKEYKEALSRVLFKGLRIKKGEDCVKIWLFRGFESLIFDHNGKPNSLNRHRTFSDLAAAFEVQKETLQLKQAAEI